MTLDEATRHELHAAARKALGTAAGDALMELLPPVGWAEVATKRDLEVLSTEIRSVVHEAEIRILMWMFTTILAGIAISVSASVAVALAV
jgi:hypothetical protein